jgi:CDP-glucose 4,6-dehydratase
MFDNVFKNKTVLVTGHTGFKGSWFCIWLKELGADVVGYALEPYTQMDNFAVTCLKDEIIHIVGDVRDFPSLYGIFEKYRPEIVFHLAAQSIVRESYNSPRETYDINVGGTVNVLECCRLSDSVKTIINITSDKCYGNKEWIWGYRENDSMGGYDPYSSSKACSELVTTGYRNSFFNPNDFKKHGKSLSSVRAGNVIGGGDWQKDRIIPDCIRALENNEVIRLRNPNAVRPWQHVLEPLGGYLLLASKMYRNPGKFCGAWNFGPDDTSVTTVKKIANMVISYWGSGSWIDMSDKNKPHEAKLLTLDITKVKSCLEWCPIWNIQKAIKATVDWYKVYQDTNVYEVCLNQIKEFCEDFSAVKSNDKQLTGSLFSRYPIAEYLIT